jgi:hypothetical protein
MEPPISPLCPAGQRCSKTKDDPGILFGKKHGACGKQSQSEGMAGAMPVSIITSFRKAMAENCEISNNQAEKNPINTCVQGGRATKAHLKLPRFTKLGGGNVMSIFAFFTLQI